MSGSQEAGPVAAGVGARADAALLGVALGWGASFVVIKGALGVTPPHWLLFLRFAVAALALALLAPRALRRVDAATWRVGTGLGVLLWAGFALQTLGLVHTTPAKSAFVTASYVPMVPLLGRLLFRVPVARAVGGSVVLAFAGLGLLLHPEDLAHVNRGDALTLLCALAFALHIVLLDRYALALPARPTAVLQLATTSVLALPFALALERAPALGSLPLWGAVLYLGVVCSAFAYGVQTWAQRHTAPTRVALIFSLESVFAALFAVGLAGERLAPGEWLGGALVVAAVLLGQWATTKPFEEQGLGAGGATR